MPIIIDDNWRERDAGAYVDASTWNELFDFDKSISVEGGESLPDFFDRVQDRIDALKQQYSDKTVVIVSHGGVHHAVYAHVSKLPRSGNMRISPMENCEYRVYKL